MTNAYIKVGVDFNHVESISTTQSVDNTIQVVLDDDLVDFGRTQGYIAYTADDGQNHLKFDQPTYDAYLAEVKKQEEEKRKQEELEQNKQDLFEALSVEYTDSDKEGYKFKVLKLGDVVISKEYVKSDDADINDGSDYTKPIVYKDGMSVEKGLWYTDGKAVWECIKEGEPSKFGDTEYFDVIETA
mgnify:CR=1 FL=1